jgi:hypothetical protein
MSAGTGQRRVKERIGVLKPKIPARTRRAGQEGGGIRRQRNHKKNLREVL